MTGWWATLTDAERAAVQLMLRPDEEFMFRDVSVSQVSIARHRGAATVLGKRYTYILDSDELVRDDVLRLVETIRKLQRKVAREQQREAAKAAQGDLL